MARLAFIGGAVIAVVFPAMLQRGVPFPSHTEISPYVIGVGHRRYVIDVLVDFGIGGIGSGFVSVIAYIEIVGYV